MWIMECTRSVWWVSFLNRCWYLEEFCLQWIKQLNAPLEVIDPEIADIIELEKARQWKVFFVSLRAVFVVFVLLKIWRWSIRFFIFLRLKLSLMVLISIELSWASWLTSNLVRFFFECEGFWTYTFWEFHFIISDGSSWFSHDQQVQWRISWCQILWWKWVCGSISIPEYFCFWNKLLKFWNKIRTEYKLHERPS